jgi:hypothetical protein
MGDRSTTNIIKDRLGKLSHTSNDARNVKIYNGKVVDGR